MKPKMKLITGLILVGALAFGVFFWVPKAPPENPAESLRAVLRDAKAKEGLRIEALLKLSIQEDAFAKQVAIEFLKEGAESLRVPSIRALSFFQDEESSRALMAVLDTHSSPAIREFVFRSLGYRANNVRAFMLEDYLKRAEKELSLREQVLAQKALFATSLEPDVKSKVLDKLLSLYESNKLGTEAALLIDTLQAIAPQNPRVTRLVFERKNKTR